MAKYFSMIEHLLERLEYEIYLRKTVSIKKPPQLICTLVTGTLVSIAYGLYCFTGSGTTRINQIGILGYWPHETSNLHQISHLSSYPKSYCVY